MPQQQTIDEVSLPLPGHLLNLWGDALAGVGLAPKPLEAQSLRRAARGDRILHVPYARLVEDPVGTATRVCERFDLPLDDDALRQMRAWDGANPPNRWGRHVYGLGPYGVDAGEVSRRYAEYTSRFITAGAEGPSLG